MKIALVLALAALAACTGPQITSRHTADPMPSLVVQPMGDDGVPEGYTVKVTRHGECLAELRTGRGVPVTLPGLQPGRYTVRISGPDLKGKARVDLKSGRALTMTWWLTAPDSDGGIRLAAGDVAFAIVTFPFRLLYFIFLGWIFGDDDDDCSKGSSSYERRSSPPKKRPSRTGW